MDFTAANGEVNALQCFDAGKTFGQAANFQQRFGIVLHAQYFRFGNSAAACDCSYTPSLTWMRFGNCLPALTASTASKSCGPMSGLHSTVQFNLPAAIASNAPLTPSMETILMSLPGFTPASSIA